MVQPREVYDAVAREGEVLPLSRGVLDKSRARQGGDASSGCGRRDGKCLEVCGENVQPLDHLAGAGVRRGRRSRAARRSCRRTRPSQTVLPSNAGEQATAERP
jgi:hypothetical protein